MWWWYLAKAHATGEGSSTKSRAEILDVLLQGSRNSREECVARVQLWGESSSTFTGSRKKKEPRCTFTRQLAGQKWNWKMMHSKKEKKEKKKKNHFEMYYSSDCHLNWILDTNSPASVKQSCSLHDIREHNVFALEIKPVLHGKVAVVTYCIL